MAVTVSLENVGFGYSSDRMLFEGISFSLDIGQTLAITGKSGAGKTSLLKLLMGVLKPTHGQVFVFGNDLATLSKRKRQALMLKQVGIIHQSPFFLPELNAQENVALQLSKATGLRFSKALHKASDLVASVGIDPKQSINTLSGGELGRLQICRAVCHEPQLILADEPNAALDKTTANEMFSLLEEQTQNAALIMITHDNELANRCTAQLVIGE